MSDLVERKRVAGTDDEGLGLDGFGDEKDGALVCDVCGIEWPIALPMSLDQVVSNLEGFQKQHGRKGHKMTKAEWRLMRSERGSR